MSAGTDALPLAVRIRDLIVAEVGPLHSGAGVELNSAIGKLIGRVNELCVVRDFIADEERAWASLGSAQASRRPN